MRCAAPSATALRITGSSERRQSGQLAASASGWTVRKWRTIASPTGRHPCRNEKQCGAGDQEAQCRTDEERPDGAQQQPAGYQRADDDIAHMVRLRAGTNALEQNRDPNGERAEGDLLHLGQTEQRGRGYGEESQTAADDDERLLNHTLSIPAGRAG